jgi:DNA-binding LytR/AlgR family response regulator
MNILIVEDEALLAKKLQNLVLRLEPNAHIVGVTNSIESTTAWLKTNAAPDLILMDIELADGQSFEIFQQAKVTSPVIFTTAYDEYALKAFKVNSIDYLLKPIKEEELSKALEKYKTWFVQKGAPALSLDINGLLQTLQQQSNNNYKDRFLVKQGQKFLPIDVNDIAYFFTKNSINYIQTKDNKKFLVDYTLDEIESSLQPKTFFRANRQIILSVSSVITVHAWFNGKLKVDVKPATDEGVVVSREKANEFKLWLGE